MDQMGSRSKTRIIRIQLGKSIDSLIAQRRNRLTSDIRSEGFIGDISPLDEGRTPVRQLEFDEAIYSSLVLPIMNGTFRTLPSLSDWYGDFET